MNPSIIPVILCGGSGTRLWPRSRADRPKPFLPLVGERVPLEEAVQRCRDAGFERPVVVAGEAHVPLVSAFLGKGEAREIIVEPHSRQTAAAIALAAFRLPHDSIMLVCPSDHHITDAPSFVAAARVAAQTASEGWLVCIGVAAKSPETRFGYIRRGEPLAANAFQVAEFVEKPDRSGAEEYLRRGDFVWNAGIFAFRAGDYISQLQKYRRDLAEAVRQSVDGGLQAAGEFRPEADAFDRIEPESVDYAVMENTDRAAVVVAQMDWSDIGDWSALRLARKPDAQGNAVRGPVRVFDSRNILAESDGPRVHIVGLEDVIVVVDGDDVLVASADSSDAVGELGKAAD